MLFTCLVRGIRAQGQAKREAQAKRTDTVRTLMSQAERQAQEANARESAKAPAPVK